MKKIVIIILSTLLLVSCNRVSGTYVNESGNGFIDKIEFIGKSSCIITAFSIKSPATYRYDNGYIYIQAQGDGSLLFKIQDSNTLVGEGSFNECTFKKVQSVSNSQVKKQKRESTGASGNK